MPMAVLFRFSVRVLIAATIVAATGGSAAAQLPVKIVTAQVGLPPNRAEEPRAAPVLKFGMWCPVYVELDATGDITEPAVLVVETPDANGLVTTLAVPLDLSVRGTLRPHERGAMPYLRPAGGETTLTVRTAKGEAISEPFRIRSMPVRDTRTYVVLSLGSRLPGFEIPKAGSSTGETESTTGPIRGGRFELASITEVERLPDQWFGYEVADLIVLTTGSSDILKRLFADAAHPADVKRREALLEWVRRGGRLVVSVGAEAVTAAGSPAFQELLPYAIRTDTPGRAVERLTLSWAARETNQAASILSGSLSVRGGTVPAANLTARPFRPAQVVIPPSGRQAPGMEPVAVQSAYGLGRVTLIAFDLDRPPFTEFGQRAEFWDWVLHTTGANQASAPITTRSGTASAGLSDEEDETAAALRTHEDTFEAVPVLSFSWVVILIALYIVLIGPLEYYFLKQILGRLELTWITLPAIVLTVSIAAYLTASASKGRELRMNTIEVIDVTAEADPRTGTPAGRVFGTTWFTIFSPRNASYTIGVTPAEGWAVPGDSGLPLLGWVGGPRGGRTGLLHRRYAYHADPATGRLAEGLDAVPIPVWSTKAFSANWTASMNPTAPVVESRLEHPPGDPARVVGTFVNRMPFGEVADCVAFYAGQAYPLGSIVAGQEVRLVLDKGQPAVQWLQDHGQLGEMLNRAAGGEPASTANKPAAAAAVSAADNTLPLWGVLFHEAALRYEEGVIPRNASLRRLDQTWRLSPDNRNEVIVVGRVLPTPGAVGGAGSASQVWLNGAPAEAAAGRRETYVRLFLPVLSAGAR